ncbi:MAG: hypothetical protein AAGA03_17030 [Planctomycetota bacterium]
MRKQLRRALDADRWVCRVRYQSSTGEITERIVSPIRLTDDRVLALCLGREEPRWFAIASIQRIELVPASEVQMPEEIRILSE